MNQLAPLPTGLTEPLSKGDVFRILNAQIPLNDYRLPDHIYRADLIPETILNESPSDKTLLLDGASLQITFEHGYPAINESTPLWDQLTGEPEDAYATFTAYLELPEKSNSDNPIRLLPLISTLTRLPLRTISDWCHQYYWHWRARAYDLFLIAAHRKQREQRAMSIEGSHFKMAEDMLSKVMKVAHKKLDQEILALTEDPDAMTETKLKDLIDMSTKLVQVQRISVGLPANGIISGNLQLDGPRHTTVEDTFKHIAQEATTEAATTPRSPEMDTLLESPDDLSKVQEMLIRLARPSHVLPAWGSGKVIAGEAEERSMEHGDAGTGESDAVEDLGNPNQ